MRLIIVSNRAPVRLDRNDDGSLEYHSSTGGLATGLTAFVEQERQRGEAPEILWIGWPGTEIPRQEQPEVERRLLDEFGVKPVFLSEEVVEQFYHGFCNKTIWPLFHYFPSYTLYDKNYWAAYKATNQVFADAIAAVAQPDDIIWVHDYQLMLVPSQLRAKMANATIGFFLHIPFPSYEVLRLLPSDWRRTLLDGMLGADLVGFHTNDYRSYFARSIQRILGVEDAIPDVTYNNRLVRLDVFPMGIDVEKFRTGIESEGARAHVSSLKNNTAPTKLVLSIDRQDYTKGILNRLEAIDYFFEAHPEWRQRMTTILVVVPSRDRVEHYQAIKSDIDELVGKINGSYGTLDWTPIVYQYRALSFDELSALYHTSDVALVTPLRDGMNLISKEYVASRPDQTGVLILSEMAGAVDELDESIIINPNIKEEIAEAILDALKMPPNEQRRRMTVMQRRVREYNVVTWANNFLRNLKSVKEEQAHLSAKLLSETARMSLIGEFQTAQDRLLFLDYDGTLTPIVRNPVDAKPNDELHETLRKLSSLPRTQVVILSGRDHHTLEEWLGDLPVDLSAEHGLFLKRKGQHWRVIKPVRAEWKDRVRPTLELFVERLPGSFIEEKDYSLVYHYRKADSELASIRVKELLNQLRDVTTSLDVQVLMGKKVVDLRTAGVDKGIAALGWLTAIDPETSFILSMGDDTTDEDLFRAMPDSAYSIKVGLQPSNARFNLRDTSEVIELLEELARVGTLTNTSGGVK